MLQFTGFFLSKISSFDRKFPSLYEEKPQDDDGNEESGKDTFTKYYGWIFATEKVAELERITLEQAYDLSTLQYLNDLVYINEKQKNEKRMMEELNNKYKVK